jgi:hypothetical protein
MTRFQLNSPSENLLKQGLGTFKFQSRTSAPCRIVNRDVPDAGVAIGEERLRPSCNEVGLTVVEPVTPWVLAW